MEIGGGPDIGINLYAKGLSDSYGCTGRRSLEDRGPTFVEAFLKDLFVYALLPGYFCH